MSRAPGAPADAGRRRLLQAGGIGLLASFTAGCAALPDIPRRPAATAEAAGGWIRHDGGGRYTLSLPRVEMGQGISDGLRRIACTELGVAWDAVQVRLPSTAQLAPVRATVGSESIRDFALPLAQACAALRDAVAAGQPPGPVAVPARGWDALRSGRWAPPLHGGPLSTGHALAVVRGEPLYAADVRRPGQLYGRVLRAPALPERASRCVALDEAAARSVPAFVALVRDPALRLGAAEGVAIVARTPGALDRIAQALAPAWTVDAGAASTDAAALGQAVDIDARLASGARAARRLRDDALEPAAPWDLDLRIDVPAAAHAPIEPRNALAEPTPGGGLQLWVGHQDPGYVRQVVARRLGVEAGHVVVQPCRVGGAFGGKTLVTVELEAALLARAAGAPVRVQWTRAQEFQQAFHRPPSSHRIRARLQDGRITHWWHAFASSHVLFTGAVLPPWLQRATDLAVGDDGVARGALLPYAVPAQRIEYHLARLPLWTGPWRGLGAGPNVLAIECAMDEAARLAASDPLQFRLAQLAPDARLAGVLRQVASDAQWGRPLPAVPGRLRGRGLAGGLYKETACAAVVADVEVDAASGRVRVLQLWCAHDCGRVIDPDQVRAQCEGNLVWGLGMALVEQLPVAGGRVAADGYADAPVPRITDIPPLAVTLVASQQPPGGAGETAIVAAGAAVLNAVRAATGVRVRQLPLRPEALAGALRAAGRAA